MSLINGSDHIRHVHISLRIPVSTKDSLEKDVKRQHTNFNSLASGILAKSTSFDKIAEHIDAIPLNGPLFSGMLEDAPLEHLESLGKELGAELIKETFVFLDLEYDIEGLIQHYFEPMSSFSKWYTFTVAGSGQNRRLMFKHSRGPKWSAFLKAYVSSIIKAATGIEPRATADNHLVTVYC